MKVYLPQRIGFCFGVKNAITLAKKELEKEKEVYSLGELVHNPQVMDQLIKEGLKVVYDLSKIKEGTVITRAHGIDYSIVEEAQKRGIKIVETTCPYVLRVQRITKLLAKESYQIVVVGSAEHPEIKSLIANTPSKNVYVVKTPEEAEKIPGEKIGVVAQTTESLDNFQNIVKNLIKNKPEVRAFNTICEVVRERREDLKELAKKVEAIIIVGGRNSSNTKQMVKVCQLMGVKTYFVEKEEDINYQEIKKLNSIGITGGTSTPEETIRKISKMLNKKPVKEGG